MCLFPHGACLPVGKAGLKLHRLYVSWWSAIKMNLEEGAGSTEAGAGGVLPEWLGRHLEKRGGASQVEAASRPQGAGESECLVWGTPEAEGGGRGRDRDRGGQSPGRSGSSPEAVERAGIQLRETGAVSGTWARKVWALIPVLKAIKYLKEKQGLLNEPI